MYGKTCCIARKSAAEIATRSNKLRLNPLAHLALTPALQQQLQQWLNEDLGRGDLTAAALASSNGEARWLAKQAGVFCGGQLAKTLFQMLDPQAKVELLVSDGEKIAAGQCLIALGGKASALVGAERTALNLAMHLSGIATATAALVEQLVGTGVRLADTRKTTPGLRVFEKYAVRCGGGTNHRLGLDDAAMLKENHLAWGGGINQAVAAVRSSAPWPARVIVEVETATEANAAVQAGADAVLLDEFKLDELQQLVPQLRALAAARGVPIWLEASGVNPNHLQAYANTGIDLISTSAAITRSPWLDISMRFSANAANCP